LIEYKLLIFVKSKQITINLFPELGTFHLIFAFIIMQTLQKKLSKKIENDG